jgi:transposase
MTTTIRLEESTSKPLGMLLLAFELGQARWTLGFSTGLGAQPRIRTILARDLRQLQQEIASAKVRFGLTPQARVVSCYEAGRDGFWLHRWLTAEDITNQVLDASSIEVPRRLRRAKTDRLDVQGLLRLLARYVLGERRACRVIRVPSDEAEDARQVHRAIETLHADRTRIVNRLRSVLIAQGIRPANLRAVGRVVADARRWDGTPLPPGVRCRLACLEAQCQHVDAQLRTLTTERTRLERHLTALDPENGVARLLRLRGIGDTGAWVLMTEVFAWREIRNRRQLGALLGVVSAPYDSGDSHRDQGITKAGLLSVRRLGVQLAWGWLRFQPASALSQWYQARFAQGGPRLRRIGIVALMRRLMIALWRYVDHGHVPAGATLKPPVLLS